MQQGLFGSLCFLAFLLFVSAKDQNALNSQDLIGSSNDAEAVAVAKGDNSKVKSSQDESSVTTAVSGTEQGNLGNSGRPNWSVPPLGPYVQNSAEVRASAESVGNNPSNLYSFPNTANAYADRNALANADGSSFGSNSNAQATTDARSSANVANNPWLGQAYPNSNAADAYAGANALHNAGGPLGLNGNAQAAADAQASADTFGHGHPNLNQANSYAEANAVSNNDQHLYGTSGYRSGDNQDESGANLANHAVANSDLEEANRMGGNYYNYGAFSGAVSRAVSSNEIIRPDLMPGGFNLIQCNHEYEIHTVWSPALQCMVCVCVRDGWALTSKCVKCSSCLEKPAPLPVPIIPTPPPLPPRPEPQVSCSPLPTDTPFENPLNPCQTCICHKIVNVFGNDDVQIKCEENPSCVTPPEFIPIPPQVPLKPVPMPLCESLPPNVQFPHPTEHCMVCRCVVEITSQLIPERRMICQPDLECENTHEVIIPPPPPVTEYPLVVYPTLPTTPPPTEVQPVPWPPIVAPLPSPLPGPPPHDTCSPYPPNTPFQHPWDECQICVCAEIYGNNVVNIEVNCYTKKSCCIEPPIPEPVPVIPYKPLLQPSLIGNNAEASSAALAQGGGTASSTADAYSNVGGLYNQGQASSSALANAIASGANQYPFINGSPSSSYSSADASASSNANLLPPRYSNSYPYSLGQSISQAQAEAIGNSQQGNVLSLYPYQFAPGGQSSAQSLAEAAANSQSSLLSPYGFSPYSLGGQSSQAQAEALANSQSGNVLSPYPYQFAPSGQSSAQSEAEAAANSQSSLLYPYGFSPYSLGGQSSALAQSQASAQSNGQQLNGAPYGGLYYPGQSQSSAQSEASANAQSLGPLSLVPNIYYQNGHSISQADAIANAQALGSSYYGKYLGGNQASSQATADAIAGSQMYPSLYPYATPNVGPLYQLGVNGWDNTALSQSQAQAQAQSQAQAQAQSQAQAQGLGLGQAQGMSQSQTLSLLGGSLSQAQSQSQAMGQGSANAQSIAQAASMLGRPLIKSGKGLCKYSGDQYHHNCQACYCLSEPSGEIYTLCLGSPCA